MNNTVKNKTLTILVVLLLLANAATLAFFWLGRKPKQPPGGMAKEFLIKELNLNTGQQEAYEGMIKEHRQATEPLRQQIKEAKDELFALVKNPSAPDSAKQAAAASANNIVAQLDLVTLNHFQKVRTLCTVEQQKKFDDIIQEAIRMTGQPRHPMPPGGHPQGPPPGGEGGPPPPPAGK